MLSTQWTSLAVLASIIPVFSQGPRVPDPLPLITPFDVVNLMIQDSDDSAGDLVASVIAVDATATTFLIACATPGACGYAAWDNPIILTQGPSTAHWTYLDTEQYGFSVYESCTFDGTTASIAICTNSYNDNNNDYHYTTNSWTTVEPTTTMTYDGKVATDKEGHSMIYWPSFNGPPPFIPVKITGGLSLLKAAATSGTSSVSTSGSSSPTTQSQAITSPTITSMAKVTGFTSSISSPGTIPGTISGSSSTSVAASAAGNNNTAKPSSAYAVKASWGWCLAFVFMCLAL